MKNLNGIDMEELIQYLQSIDEEIRQIRQHQTRQDTLVDHLHNKVIAVQAALDECLGFNEDEVQTVTG